MQFMIAKQPNCATRAAGLVFKFRITTLNALALLVAVNTVFAFQQPEQSELPNFDARQNIASTNSNLTSSAHEAAVGRLKNHLPDLQISMDPTLHRPGFVSRRNGFLTGTNGGGAVISKSALNAVPANDPHRIVKAFLNEHAGVFGHDSSALTNAVVKRDYVTKHIETERRPPRRVRN
jgi:hypothetical protein